MTEPVWGYLPPSEILINAVTGRVYAYTAPMTQARWDELTETLRAKYGQVKAVTGTVQGLLTHDLRRDGVVPVWG